jgi:hypothetical protein
LRIGRKLTKFRPTWQSQLRLIWPKKGWRKYNEKKKIKIRKVTSPTTIRGRLVVH